MLEALEGSVTEAALIGEEGSSAIPGITVICTIALQTKTRSSEFESLYRPCLGKNITEKSEFSSIRTCQRDGS